MSALGAARCVHPCILELGLPILIQRCPENRLSALVTLLPLRCAHHDRKLLRLWGVRLYQLISNTS